MTRYLPVTLAEAVERFMARCERRGDCLLGPQQMYGSVKCATEGKVLAHRAAYTVHNGPIPEGLVVRHTCDEPRCVEPTHLLVGTQSDNERDKIERGRAAVGLRHAQATVPPDVIEAAVNEYLAGGISQRAIAERLGVNSSTVSSWVRGQARRDVAVAGVSVGSGSRISRPPQPCGTVAAYYRHWKHGEPACVPCRTALRDHTRERRAAARATLAVAS